MEIIVHVKGVEVRLAWPYVEQEQPTARAVTDYTALIQRLDHFKGFAADELLQLYNEDWLDEEIGIMDRTSFMARFRNPSIYLGDEFGVATVYFEDDGLFAGHYIELLVQDGLPTHAGIIG